ncbi:MAG: four helix bundle protein [Hyphomicrobiaceae bacterium]
MADVRSNRDLVAWQKSMALATACDRETATFPASEIYGMTSQIRRAGASVPANIADGYGRETTRAYVRALRVAPGSLKELDTHVLLAQTVESMGDDSTGRPLDRCEEVGRMLRALIRALQKRSSAE